jgi:hypothetical protein
LMSADWFTSIPITGTLQSSFMQSYHSLGP